MIQIRRAEARGYFDHGWLKTYHTFSFGDYYDPSFMGFRELRVINEDRVEPEKGFGTHPHRNMEILTYVLEGALEHRDSMGNGSVIRPDDVQRMTAGTGVTHSEFNPSKTDPVHFLQIWILPESKGLPPGYEQKSYPAKDKEGRWRLVASSDGRDASVTIHQDVLVWATRFNRGGNLSYILKPKRHGWLQVAEGTVGLQGKELKAGDGAAISEEGEIKIQAPESAELLLFDLR